MTSEKRQPKIAIDVTFLQDQFSSRGIGRYGKELVKRMLKKDGEVDFHLLGFLDERTNLKLLDSIGSKVVWHSLGEPQLSTPTNNSLLFRTKIKRIVNSIDPDCFFAAHFERGIPTTKAVTPIHDIIPLITGNFSQKNAVTNMLKGVYYGQMLRLARQSQEIVTISEKSKQDLVEHLDIDPKKIHVIYLGASEIFAEQIPNSAQILKQMRIGNEYLIYDGGLEQNKNADFLIQVFSILSEGMPGLKLAITGGDFKDDEPQNERAQNILSLAKRLGVKSKLSLTGRITDEQLAVLVQNATAYINLSSYEGFGLGPVQAMSAGTFTIVSDSPPFPEVVGDGALIVPTRDPVETVRAIGNGMESKQKILSQIQKGKERSKEFNWDKTFEQTWKLILKVAKK